jgi:hypothetical protein
LPRRFRYLAYKAYIKEQKAKFFRKERVKNDTQNIQGISRGATTLGESSRNPRE